MRVPIRLSAGDTGGAYTGALEMTILKWLRTIGDTVDRGDDLITISTDKVAVTLCAPVGGVLVEITCPNEKKFIVEEIEEDDGREFYTKVLGYIETTPSDNEQHQATPPTADSEREEEKPPRAIPSESTTKFTPLALRMLQNERISPTDVAKRFPDKRKIDKGDVETFLAEREQRASPANQEVGPSDKRSPLVAQEDVRAMPAARRLAMEKGIDIGLIRGTGPDGVITLKDVEDAPGILSEQPVHPPNLVIEGEDEWEVVRPSPFHLSVARHMQEGWKTPTAQPTLECDLSKMVWFRTFYAEKFERTFGIKLRLTFPLVAALVRTLANREVAQWFNGYWDAKDPNEPVFRYCKNVHLGVSLNDSAGELLILTLHGANQLPFRNLAFALEEMGQKAKTGIYTLKDATGFTFIFNNIGALRMLIPEHLRGKMHVVSGYSLLPPKISALLNIATIEAQGGTTLQLSFDHRSIMGGRIVTKFFVALYEELERVLKELSEECDRTEKTNA